MDNNNNIDLKKSKRLRAVRFSCMTVLAAVVSSLALHVFVYPAAFVPLGLEAVVTMLYALFPSINAGYFNLLLNVPLVIYAFFKLPKRYVAYTLAFTLLSSLFLILWEKVGLPEYEIPLFTAEGAVEPITDAGRRLIAAIFAGIMLGVRTGLMLKMGASTGGVDIIAAVVLVSYRRFLFRLSRFRMYFARYFANVHFRARNGVFDEKFEKSGKG